MPVVFLGASAQLKIFVDQVGADGRRAPSGRQVDRADVTVLQQHLRLRSARP